MNSTLEGRCAEALVTAEVLNRATRDWHTSLAEPPCLVLQLHHANFKLWHLEDEARDPESGDAAIASVKRNIDRVNQHRNDTAEAIDAALLALLAERNLPAPDAPLHSETPGQMLDRLSILSLKLFHTALEVEREGVDDTHRERNRQRLSILHEQQADLASCLQDLWRDILGGSRRFKLYLQHKMYNDPALNPVLYRDRTRSAAAPYPKENSSGVSSS